MRKNNAGRLSSKNIRLLSGPRIKIVGLVFAVMFLMVAFRLGKLMLQSEGKVAEYAQRQKFSSMELHSPRGIIYDRNMGELAISLRMKSIYLNPQKVEDPKSAAKTIAENLAPGNRKAVDQLAKKIEKRIIRYKSRYFMWVERKAGPEIYERVKEANIRGIGFVDEYKRFYPKRDMMSKIIGFCGMDNQGLSGLEYYYDRQMHSVNAKSRVKKDAFGRPVETPDIMDMPGAMSPYDLALTIDEKIQYITEKALAERVKSSGAQGGVAIVMDPNAGDILAVAEQPRFNPNNFKKYTAASYKSHAISNPVEPGSTFKVFVTAAALEEKTIKPDSLIYCENGAYKTGGKVFKEAHLRRFGRLPVSQVIAKSSNIGAIKIGETLGQKKLDKYLREFGFGERTGVDMPAESQGTLRDISNWSQVSLPSISFGQEVSVTPIQLISAFSVFANGGYVVKPRIIKALMRDGKIIKSFSGRHGKKVLSTDTVKTMARMMTQVVSEGTGTQASVDGFAVAGKTGTAQIFDNKTGAYFEDKHISSFIGFFPAEKPALAILVMIHSPKGVAWGGAVAGPVFAQIASRSADILKIPSEHTEIYKIDWAAMKSRVANIRDGV